MKTYAKIAMLSVVIFLSAMLTGCGSGDGEIIIVHEHYIQPYQEVIYAGVVQYTTKYVYSNGDVETDIDAKLPDGSFVTYTVAGDMTIYASYETLSIIYDHLSDGTVAGPYLVANHDTTYYWGYLLLDTYYW